MEATIDSLKITITKSTGGEFPALNLEKNEWYPSVVKSIALSNGQFGPQLEIRFELQGDGYQIELGGEMKQIIVKGLTSVNGSTQSKFYSWYTAIMGDVDEGTEVAPKQLVGKSCYVMVEPSKSKTDETKIFWNVVMVKGSKKQVPQKVSPVVLKKGQFQANNPDNVTEPEEISGAGIGTTVTPKKKLIPNTDF